jgi:hypothetical protein
MNSLIRYWSFATIALVLVCFTSSCASAPTFDAAYTRISDATLQAGQSIPALQDKALFTVTGKVQAKQQLAKGQAANTKAATSAIGMDRSNLTALGLVEYEVTDPFEKKKNQFRGVLLRDLLQAWQVAPDAKQMTLTALNDYKITIPLALMRQYPMVLAIEQNGAMMQNDYRGPAMIVTPYEQYANVKDLANRDYWIWQVAKIHIE